MTGTVYLFPTIKQRSFNFVRRLRSVSIYLSFNATGHWLTMIQHTLLMLAVKLAVKFNGGIYICFVYMVSRSLVPRRSLCIRCPREVWKRGRVSRGDVTARGRVQEWPSRKRLGTRLGFAIFGRCIHAGLMLIAVLVVAPRLLVNETPSLHCSGNRGVNF